MYHLFLDESGDDHFLKQDGTINHGCTKNITIGGIIVKDSDIQKFHNEYNNLVNNYFAGVSLGDKFKLHYNTLKIGKKSPYKEIHFEGRSNLSRDVFSILDTLDCHFLACNIHKPSHWSRYGINTRNPKAYALLVCVEIFIDFLQEFGQSGTIIYEEFEKIRKQMGDELNELLSYPTFPNIHNLQDVAKFVRSGKPKQHPILQFSDFVAHSVWFHNERPNQVKDMFFELTNKMYKFRSI
jgi:hypothetical protein